MKHPKLKYITAKTEQPPGTVLQSRTVNLKRFIPLLNDADVEGMGQEKIRKLLCELSLLIEVRRDGALVDRGFYLPDEYDWSIVIDDGNSLVLVPQKKTAPGFGTKAVDNQ